MKVCIVIGHNKYSQGAVNKRSGISEFLFNRLLAYRIKEDIETDVDIEIVFRDTYAGLPSKINSINPDFIISLHCNAFNTIASGTEVLYWHKTTKSDTLASILQKNLVAALDLPDRGIKPRNKKSRGALLLRKTNAPCVIAEPFFIDRDYDLTRATFAYDKLVMAFVDTINEYAKLISNRTSYSVEYLNGIRGIDGIRIVDSDKHDSVCLTEVEELTRKNELLTDFIDKEYNSLFEYVEYQTGDMSVMKKISFASIIKAKELINK